MLPLPTLAPYFAGREEERRNLLRILERYGSAAITQDDGLGKTEVMLYFVELAREKGLAPGGIFWVAAEGNKERMLSSFADFAEHLGQSMLPKQDRRCVQAVVSLLRRALEKIEGRWLLCVHNANCQEGDEILGEVAKLCGPKSGWLVVTSRRGDPQLWPGMAVDQRLRLKLLSLDEARAVLWRTGKGVTRESADDEEVLEDIDRTRYMDSPEYRALTNLAGAHRNYGLGGLPLALIQAGGFIRSAEMTFTEFVEIYMIQMRISSEELDQAVDAGVIRDHERSIWVTWRLGVDALGEDARRGLRAVAILGKGEIRQRVLRLISAQCRGGGPLSDESGLLYYTIMKRDLVNRSAILNEAAKRGSFRLNSVFRRYVQFEATLNWPKYCLSQEIALRAVHSTILEQLGMDASTFDSLEEVQRHVLLTLLSHAVTVVQEQLNGRRLADAEEQIFLEVTEPLAAFSVSGLNWSGRTAETEKLCTSMLEFLCRPQNEQGVCSGASRSSQCFMRDRDTYFNRGRKFKQISNKYLLQRSEARVSIGNVDGAESDVRRVISNRKNSMLRYLPIRRQSQYKEIAASSDQLGKVLEQKGDYDEAELEYRESLFMKRRIYGKDADHVGIASSIHQLGMILQEKGDYEGAESEYRESLCMNRRIHGKDADHPDIAASIYQLGMALEKKGDYKGAESEYQASLCMSRRIHGENVDHPSIAAPLHQLENVVEGKGGL